MNAVIGDAAKKENGDLGCVYEQVEQKPTHTKLFSYAQVIGDDQLQAFFIVQVYITLVGSTCCGINCFALEVNGA